MRREMRPHTPPAEMVSREKEGEREVLEQEPNAREEIMRSPHELRAMRLHSAMESFRSGEVREDHPMYQKVHEVMVRIASAASRPTPVLHIHSSPSQENAYMNGLGEVHINAALILAAQSIDGVAGFLAHELQHDTNEDVAKRIAIQKPLRVKKGRLNIERRATDELKSLSATRVQEHRADIEGAVLNVDAAGYNPLGYKLELQRFAARERAKRARTSATHGTSIDRALSVGVLARYHDLSNLDEQLELISDAQKKDWKKNLAVHRYLPDAFKASTHLQPGCIVGINQELKTLSPEDANTFLLTLMSEWGNVIGQQSDTLFLKTKKWLEPIIQETQRRTDTLLAAPLEPFGDDAACARSVYYDLYLGAPLFEKRAMDLFGRSHLDQGYARIKSREDLPLLASVVERMSNFPGDYAVGNVSEWAAHQIIRLNKGDAYMRDGELDTTKLIDDADTLLRSAQGILDTKGISEGSHAARMTQALFRVVDAIDARVLNEYAKYETDVKIGEEIKQRFPEVRDDVQENEAEVSLELRELKRAMNQGGVLGMERYRTLAEVKGGAQEKRDFLYSFLPHIEKLASAKEVTLAYEYLQEQFSDMALSIREKESAIRVSGNAMNEFERVAAELLNESIKTLSERYVALRESRSEFASWSDVRWQTHVQPIANAAHWKGVKNFEEADLFNIEAIEKNRESLFAQWKVAAEADKLWLLKEYKILYLGVTYSGFAQDGYDMYQFDADLPCHVLIDTLTRMEPEQMLRYLDALEEDDVDLEKILFKQKHLAGPLVQKIASSLLERNKGQEDLAPLELLARLVSDPVVRAQLGEYLTKERIQHVHRFEDRLNILCGQKAEDVSLALIDDVIEEDMRTSQDVELARKKMRDIVEELSGSGSAQVGVAAIMDTSGFGKRNPIETLVLLMGTHKSDQELREVLLSFDLDKEVRGLVGRDDDALENEPKFQKQDDIDRLERIDRTSSSICAVGEGARQAITKRLLVDSRVLEQPRARVELMKTLLERSITKETQSEDVSMKRALEALAGALEYTEDWELLFYMLGPEIAKRICQPPAEHPSWDQIYYAEDQLRLSPEELEKIGKHDKSTVAVQRHAPWRQKNAIQRIGEDLVRNVLEQRGALVEQGELKDGISATEFAVETASRLGALAVRFLQIVPQFVEIPAREQETFSRLYDRMRGQSKLTAASVVEREWKKSQGDSAWDHIEEIGDRIGGGSLMTVYALKMKAGKKRVGRVRNPNLAFHMDASKAFVQDLFEGLLKSKAITVDQKEQMGVALNMVDEWIRSELSFTGFPERNAQFKLANDGFKAPGGEFSIYVPEVSGPETDYFQIEEKIDGNNLTDWEQLELAFGTEGMKDCVETIILNTRHQIGKGLMHGDIHPGNFRITPDKQIAILDRTGLLEISGLEQRILHGVFEGEMDYEALQSYVGELLGDRTDYTKLAKPLMELQSGLAREQVAVVNKAILELRQAGVGIPLRMSLFLRNYQGLSSLASKAGTSIRAAITRHKK